MGSYYRSHERFCVKKGKDISIVENREGEGIGICERSVEKGIYLTIEVTTNITGILCTKEGWEKENGVRLSILE